MLFLSFMILFESSCQRLRLHEIQVQKAKHRDLNSTLQSEGITNFTKVSQFLAGILNGY